MDKHIKELFEAMVKPDSEMVADADQALTDLVQKWDGEDKLGPQAMAAMMIAVVKKYAGAGTPVGLPSEALPMAVSMAWAIVVSAPEEEEESS